MILTFFIVAAAALAIAWTDVKGLRENGQASAVIFYCTAMCLSLLLIAAYCFGQRLPGIPGL